MFKWSALECLPGLSALPHVWKKFLGVHFRAFQILCLQFGTEIPSHVPCPNECGCDHFIVRRQHDSLSAVCCCNPPHCPDIALTTEQVTPLVLDWHRLGRGLCQALGLQTSLTPLAQPNSLQLGSWSSAAIPAIITIHSDRTLFRATLAELAATHQPFILIAPTARFLDLPSRQALKNSGAALFDLPSIVTLTDHGTLMPRRAPGELFAQFNPDPRDSASDSAARQILALVEALDSQTTCRKAPMMQVFWYYCVKGLPAAKVAVKCSCARSVVFDRLRVLGQKIGRNPAELRQYSSHFEQIGKSLSDPRARRIHLRSALDSPSDPDDY